MKPNVKAFMIKCLNDLEGMKKEKEILGIKGMIAKHEVSDIIIYRFLGKEPPRVLPSIEEAEKMREIMSDAKVARELGVSETWVRKNCKPIKRVPRSVLIKEQMDLGRTQVQISNDLGISIGSVGYHWHKILDPSKTRSPVTIANDSIEKRVLNTGKWKIKEHTFKVYGELVSIGSRPLPGVNLKPYSGVPYLI